ncbi:hypothetical protein BDR07DRAFT_1610358 [Suillus spraguei]|nr:hypothetical protein BDR07DRAFT_1610358 [Suillus spraguei]
MPGQDPSASLKDDVVAITLPQFRATFIVHLDTYTKTTTETNGKAKSKEVKSTKVKELVFQISEPNYLEFLTIILAKHDKSQYRVTERKKYGFKYLVGNSRGQVIFVSSMGLGLISAVFYSRVEAMDVDNQEDYAEMRS